MKIYCDRCKARPFVAENKQVYGIDLCMNCVEDHEKDEKKKILIERLLSSKSVVDDAGDSIIESQKEIINQLRRENDSLQDFYETKLLEFKEETEKLLKSLNDEHSKIINMYEKQLQTAVDILDRVKKDVKLEDVPGYVSFLKVVESGIDQGLQALDDGLEVPKLVFQQLLDRPNNIESSPEFEMQAEVSKQIADKFEQINKIKKEEKEKERLAKFERLSKGKSVVKK